MSASALWQIGSNTKAFTAVLLLKLEAEGKLSISDPIGKWLPQYPAWRLITIRQLLDMTSRIPDYTSQPAFVTALAKNPARHFTAAQLVSDAVGVPLTPKGYTYSNTGYILALMIIQQVTHDTYAGQLTKQIITPLHLHSLCYAPATCPAADAALMPAGYFFETAVPSLLGKAMPPLAETWAQAAGAIVSSLSDMTTWDRALYQGQELRSVRGLQSAMCRGHGGGDRPGVWPDSCAFDHNRGCRVHPECGGTCGHVRRPVQVGRIGQAGSERRAAQPHGTADAGQFSVAQPWAALGWLVDKQRVRVLDKPSMVRRAA